MDRPLDIAIIGAGIAGIGAAARFRTQLPGKTIRLFERRTQIGGTWDLFRYPGIRSDSDMYTLGYATRPWASDRAIVGGDDIRAYIEQSANDADILRDINFGMRLDSANWSSEQGLWTLSFTEETSGKIETVHTRLIYMATGYYDYDKAYRPKFDGEAEYEGHIVHPQHWPENLEVSGKRISIIGSGATAITLAPALAERGARVSLIQRSPTYIAALPVRSSLARTAYRYLPEDKAYRLIRALEQRTSSAFYRFCRKWPKTARRYLFGHAAKSLGSKTIAKQHFSPDYDPWTQRVCVAPNGDFFTAVRKGEVEMHTDSIDRIEPDGIRLSSGDKVTSDIIVTATGLRIALFGKAEISVDGIAVKPARETIYKGVMLSGVPNMIFVFGYTNASWTLKADLVAAWTVRLLREMDVQNAIVTSPGQPAKDVERLPMTDFSSGYFRRSAAIMPRQGSVGPWTLPMNYRADKKRLLKEPILDGQIILS